MFGWNNIYVIDNYSTDGTYEKILEFSNLINIFRENDYKKKGEYMTQFIRKYCNENDRLGFPIDIDEFIVYYDPNNNNKDISINKDLILDYINTLPPCRVYKANYIYPIITNKDGYERATIQSENGFLTDMGHLAKSFIDIRYFNGNIDHGNHLPCHDYHLTKIHLIHYHQRNINQMKKKILNNVIGLGYSNNINDLNNLINNNPHIAGNHHIKSQINIIEDKYELSILDIDDINKINIKPLKDRIIFGYY
jgi:hypothetical protein